MVVIVIRAQPKDSGEEIYPQRTSYSVENPPRVFASSRMPETYDERDCFNESWPSSHDLGLNANLEPRNSKFVNGNRTLYNKTPERIPWEGEQERCFGYSDSCARGYTSEQRTSEYRLDSPLSKDSGFSDKVTPCKTKRIAYYRVPETREKFIRQTRLPSSTTFLERNRHNVDNNNSTAYLSCSSQVDPEDSIATTKEEEWVTKKKIELTTTRQIETRVKRQVVLEDGKVVEDSGPMVTTNTTEDTEKQEHNQTEHRTLGDDNEGENWISVSNPTGCVKEVQEKTVKSREETEERLETENVQHLGDISDEGYMTAIKSGSDDFRQALEVSNRREIAESGPKIIHQSLKTKKYIDTEDKKELSQVQPGGKIVNETRTTRLHEEYGDCNVSDDEDSFNSGSLYETTKKENSQRYKKTKEQDITEYIANGQKIGEKLHYQAETTEGEREGDHFNMDEMDSLATRLKRMRLRSQNRLALENDTTDHKDVLMKKSSNFDQEEETRKAETSKWLEYHFGSESTKSSKGSVEDLDDIVPSTQSSFISVTMKSQPLKKTPKTKYLSSSDEDRITSERVVRNFSSDNDSYISPPGKGGYFQGISQWSSKKEEKIEPSVTRASNVQSPSFYKERPYSPLQSKPQIIRNHYNSTTITKTGSEDRYSPAVESVRRFQPISQTKSDASISSKTKIKTYEFSENRNQSPASFYQYSDQEKNRPSPPQRKKKEMSGYGDKDFEVRSRRVNGPSFDAEHKSDHISLRSSTPKDEDATTFSLPANKKLYQRTRFAADIPPPQPRPVPVKQKSKIGESFRKFVGKLRSSSADRKNKKRSKSNGSRSPSPRENTYQNYNSLDNYGSLVDRGAEEIEEPIAPPRGKYNGNVHSRPTGDGDRSLQRYYLGEDPFSASIYGREKEYEENKNLRNRRLENDTDGEGDFKSRTLGRFSKSTSRLINAEVPRDNYSYDRGGVRTLPRKFRDEINDKPVNSTKSSQEPSTYAPNRWKFNKRHLETKESLPHSGSMINVSIVNQPYDTMKRSGIHLQGPAKPARTYRTNLSRSQSFNVEPGERGFKSYKSNPHLHSLDETAPLESPSIISNWSQSSKYLSEDRSKIPETKDKRKLFMKGLYDRAPELFKTLHGDHLDEVQNMKLNEPKNYVNYSNSFRSTSTVNTNSSSPQYNRYIPRDNYIKTSPVFTETYQDDNVIKTVSRSESSGNDDYSETVRIKSKSDDPLNPSETDTVKIFSKKKIPLKNGHTTETIESSETKTIVKSQGLRGGLESDRSFYNRSPSGVVIKVRNSRN